MEEHEVTPPASNCDNSNNNNHDRDTTINKEDPPPIVIKGPTPLPRKPIYIICAILFCESFVSSMIFPFVNFMVNDFNIAHNEAEIGYYSGYLASSFFLGQFASSYIWGSLSDKYGRRPILLIGVFGSMVSASFFGFSPSYAWAIAIRTFGGLMNSNFAIARSYLGDITDETNRVRGFSFVGLMWGAGSIVGPSTGGLLSNPGDTISLPEGHLLLKYPYILPSIVSGLLSFISWLIAYKFLKESNKAVIQRKEQQKALKEKELELVELRIASESLLSSSEAEDREDREEGSGDEGATVKEATKGGSFNRSTSEPLIREEEEERTIAKEEVDTGKSPVFGMFRAWFGGKKNRYSHLKEGDGADENSVEEDGKAAQEVKEIKKGLAEQLEIFKDRSVVVCIVLLSLASTCVVAIDEIFPLWAMNPPPVGINFKSGKIGLSWAIGGITLVLFQGVAYPFIAQKAGLLKMIRVGSIGFVVTYMSYPMLGMLANKGAILWLALSGVLFGRYVAGSSVGTSLNILVNSVGGEKVRKHRGMVNGVAMSVSGLARAAAPVLGSSIFAWSNTNGKPFPFNHYFVFEVMSVLLIVIFLMSFLISKNSIK